VIRAKNAPQINKTPRCAALRAGVPGPQNARKAWQTQIIFTSNLSGSSVVICQMYGREVLIYLPYTMTF